MFMKRISALVLSLIMLISAFAFSSCSKQTDDREGNAYVSVYVYNSNGKQFVKCDAVKVSPDENHQYEWGKSLTPFLALEAACASKEKRCKIDTDVMGEYSVAQVDKFAAGEDSEGNPMAWELYINGEKISETKDVVIKNYDKIEFYYKEVSYRAITVTLSAIDNGKKVIDETDQMIMGEKNDLTIKYMLNHEYLNDKKQTIKGKFGITVDDETNTVTKIGDVSNTDEYVWKVLVNDFEITESIDTYLLVDGDELRFEYSKIEDEPAEETGEAAA